MSKFKDITGKRFGRLVALRIHIGEGRTKWWCKCECGEEKLIPLDSLSSGRGKSCGCLRKELTGNKFRKHGKPDERLYSIWLNMRDRCNNPNNDLFHRYGGRGIKITGEWNDFQKFYDWAISNGYNKELTIDRIDNDGMYEPVNCRWADRIQQMNNTSTNVFTEIKGEVKTLSEHARDHNINYFSLLYRYDIGLRGDQLIAPLKKKKLFIEYDGKVKCLKEWSRELGFTYGTLQSRYNKGLRGKELFGPLDLEKSKKAKKRQLKESV